MKSTRAMGAMILATVASGVLESAAEPSRNVGLDHAVRQFSESRSADAWEELRDLVDAATKSASTHPCRLVLEFHETRLKRDLPNSMTLLGITPNEAVERSILALERLLDQLRVTAEEDTWTLLGAMVLQDFDEHLIWTAGEIAFELSRHRFDEWEAGMPRESVTRKATFRRIRERFSVHAVSGFTEPGPAG